MTDTEIIKALEQCAKDSEGKCHAMTVGALNIINRQKAEIESIVHCKDCSWYMEMTHVPQYNGHKARYCAFYNQLENENGYCSHGLRKDDSK